MTQTSLPFANRMAPRTLGSVGELTSAIGITAALFLPLTAADLYLSADRSGILPINGTAISFLALASVFGFAVITSIARDGGRSLCSPYAAAAPPLTAFALLTLVQLFGGFLPAANWAGSGKVILLALYGFAIFFFSMAAASIPVLQRHYRRILLICLLGLSGSIFVDVFFPETFSKLITRPAGFAKDPNFGASTAVILAIGAVDWRRNRLENTFVWAVAGLAVLATLSRSGILLYTISITYYLYIMFRIGASINLERIILAVIFIIIFFILYNYLDFGDTIYSPSNQRVRLLRMIASGDLSALTEDSRATLARIYIETIAKSPFLGVGTGFSKTLADGPHNYFLLIWLENGLIGLMSLIITISYIYYYFSMLENHQGKLFCVIMFTHGFFTHLLLDMRPTLVMLGLLIALAPLERGNGSGRAMKIAAPPAASNSRPPARSARTVLWQRNTRDHRQPAYRPRIG